MLNGACLDIFQVNATEDHAGFFSIEERQGSRLSIGPEF
jgi:hypothetical protein